MRGVTKRSNEVTENRATRKKSQGTKILKSFTNMYTGVRVSKHRDFLVCPGTTISSKTKPKLLLKPHDLSKQNLGSNDWMSFSLEIVEQFQTAEYVVF